MRFGIFSDVHGHLEALRAVLNDMEAQRVDQPVCLGDLVGRGPKSGACLEIIKGLSCPIVQGNHDGFASWPEFNELDWEAPFGCAKNQILNQEQKTFLSSLPLVAKVNNFTIVHASLHQPESWVYIETSEVARQSFEVMEGSLAFNGHTHVPRAFIHGVDTHLVWYKTLKIQPGFKYIINPGSVGEPRDRDPRPAYAIYDDQEQQVELRRLG